MAVANFVIPCLILANRRTRTVVGTVIASCAVLIGMWLERFTIVVPTLLNPRLPIQATFYHPTWVEWSIMAGNVATFVLLYMLFAKLFPLVSIWEIRAGREQGVQETLARLRAYLPGHEPEAT
jgi:molybdopterin-containing oxidoreductase family membrane subunit